MFILLLLYVCFFMLGMPHALLGVAWPQIRLGFGLPVDALGNLTILSTIAGALACFTNAYAIRLGTRRLLVAALGLLTLALVLFAVSGNFVFLIIAAIPLGYSMGTIDTTCNRYVALHYPSRYLVWMHCAWGAGAFVAPYIMTYAIAALHMWRYGYGFVAVLTVGVAVLLFVCRKGWDVTHNSKQSDGVRHAKDYTLRNLPPWLNMATYFLGSGSEYTITLWLVTLLIESRGVDTVTAGVSVSLYFAAVVVTRLVLGPLTEVIGNRKAVLIGIGLALAGGVALTFGSSGILSYVGICLMGSGLSTIFPCTTYETPRRFGERTTQWLMGLQIGCSSVGMLIMPPIVGFLARQFTLELFPVMICVNMILLYAVTITLNAMTRPNASSKA